MKKLLLILVLLFVNSTFAQNGGYALNFDGIDDYVDLGNSNNLKPTDAMTVEFWVNPSAWKPTSSKVMISNTQSGGWNCQLGYSTSYLLAFSIYTWGTYQITTFDPVGYTGWHHIAVTFNGTNIYLYVDGIQKNSKTSSGGYIYYDATANNSTLIGVESGSGVNNPTPGYYFEGAIDELRIWNIARSQAIIQADMDNELVGNESGLLAYYKMSNGTGTILDDNQASGINDGIIYGTSWISSDAPLPVELTSFTANLIENKVVLNWQTATEVKNYGFSVERAANLRGLQNGNGDSNLGGFSTIGFVQGNGNSNSPKSYSFTDATPPSGKVQYRLKQIDFDGKFEYSKEVEVKIELPIQFKLAQNYPNPFNPETVISYELPFDGKVELRLYDLLGREVAELVNEEKVAGRYEVKLSVKDRGSNLSSGVYYYQLRAGTFMSTKKFVILK